MQHGFIVILVLKESRHKFQWVNTNHLSSFPMSGQLLRHSNRRIRNVLVEFGSGYKVQEDGKK
jgi:hypothetical protein